MGKYLIRVESMDGPSTELDAKYGKGIEVDGFVIIADRGEDVSMALHHVTIDDIADALRSDDNLLCAAIVAKARHDVTAIKSRNDKENIMRNLLRGMLDREEE